MPAKAAVGATKVKRHSGGTIEWTSNFVARGRLQILQLVWGIPVRCSCLVALKQEPITNTSIRMLLLLLLAVAAASRGISAVALLFLAVLWAW